MSLILHALRDPLFGFGYVVKMLHGRFSYGIAAVGRFFEISPAKLFIWDHIKDKLTLYNSFCYRKEVYHLLSWDDNGPTHGVGKRAAITTLRALISVFIWKV